MKRTQLWASGGGVQSAAIAGLIVTGAIEPPDLAVIIDTEREQSTTWQYMDAVITPALRSVGVELHRVRKSEFEPRDLYGGEDGETLLLPVFTNQSGEPGKLSNYCSSYWKREVVKRWANAQGVTAVDLWLGISVDETRRVQKEKAGKWRTRYPLIERRMNRGNCVHFVTHELGWPTPPRSSCNNCPNHNQDEWREIKARPVDWAQAIQVDRQIRERDPHAFLHPDMVPLEEANLDDSNGVLFGHGCTSGHCFT